MSGVLVLVLRILLALALYSFLCLALWMVWQDLKRAGFQSLRPKVPPLRLLVRPDETEAFSRAFTQAEVTLGRDPICELRIDDEAISARHAKFSFHHGQWWIEDLHSTNGTSLNQSKLTTAAVLTNGDEVKCGQVRLIVKLNMEAPAAPVTPRDGQHG